MEFFQSIIALPRYIKQSILLFVDSVLLLFALWFSFSLRLGELFVVGSEGGVIWLFVIAPFIAIPVFIRFGLYRAIIRYLGMRAAWAMVQAVALYAVLWGLVAMLSGVPGIPRSVVLINAMVALLVVGSSRALARWILSHQQEQTGEEKGKRAERICCVIFGAGEAGRQLAVGLLQSREYSLSGFVDDNSKLHGRTLMGVLILPLEKLEQFAGLE